LPGPAVPPDSGVVTPSVIDSSVMPGLAAASPPSPPDPPPASSRPQPASTRASAEPTATAPISCDVLLLRIIAEPPCRCWEGRSGIGGGLRATRRAPRSEPAADPMRQAREPAREDDEHGEEDDALDERGQRRRDLVGDARHEHVIDAAEQRAEDARGAT